MSFGAAEWLAAISVVVGIIVAIQSARFERSERQVDELERLYSLLYHHCAGYGLLSEDNKIKRITVFIEAVRNDNSTLAILYDIEPLYRTLLLRPTPQNFEAFSLHTEAYYLQHSDYLLWQRNAESRENERFFRTIKLNFYRLMYFIHAHSMRFIIPFAILSVIVGYVQYTQEQYGLVHYSYTSFIIFIIMSVIAYIHSHPNRWKEGLNRQLGDLAQYEFVKQQIMLKAKQ